MSHRHKTDGDEQKFSRFCIHLHFRAVQVFVVAGKLAKFAKMSVGDLLLCEPEDDPYQVTDKNHVLIALQRHGVRYGYSVAAFDAMRFRAVPRTTSSTLSAAEDDGHGNREN